MFAVAVDTSLATALPRAQVLDDLAKAGVHADGAATTVLLVVDRVDDGAEQAVRRLSTASTRVLVLRRGDPWRDLAAPWRLLHAGAGDVLEHQPGWEQGVAARLQRWEAVDQLVDSPLVRDHLVGTSRAWRAVLRRVVEVARFSTAPVLLTGETGTGKELVARLVHALHPGPERGALVLVDCTTVVPTLSGSEFFGHERGAFTGAVTAREGAFAAADGGALFLDEVGELPPTLQAELLRVVQEGTYKRVGGSVWHRTSFRLVCATHRDLLHDADSGRFRADLYYRIAGGVVHLPPLRTRREDVLPLFLHFLAAEGAPAPELHPSVVQLLEQRNYPGNVRDLRHLAARVRTRHVGAGPITPGDLPAEEWPQPDEPPHDWFREAAQAAVAAGMTYGAIRDAATDAALQAALQATDGNVQQAAARLAVTDRTVQKHEAARRGGTRVPSQRS